MSSSFSPPGGFPDRVSFSAVSAEPTTELFLIDAKMQLVARGRAKLETAQPPGVYKLKLRAGPSTREELVVLRDAPEERTLAPLEFVSAAPLDQTGQTHEYQQDAAVRTSREIHRSVGTGAALFVFAREWTPGEASSSPSNHHPAEGLSLRAQNGDLLVDIHAVAVADLRGDAWAACRVEVDPGVYRLAVETATGEVFQMAVPAPAGWDTNIFLLQRETERWGRRPNLAGASILYGDPSRGQPGFGTADRDDRLAEMAKLALTDRRRLLSDDLTAILEGKFQNPMLGILGGHLALLEPKPNRNLLRTVVSNLRRLLGPHHPDVEALALGCALRTDYVFETPPLLRQSWGLVVEHSLRQPTLVKPGSLAAAVGTQVTAQEPWLIWRESPSEKRTKEHRRQLGTFITEQLTSAANASLTRFVASGGKGKLPALPPMVQSLHMPVASVAELAAAVLGRAATRTPAPRLAAKKKTAAPGPARQKKRSTTRSNPKR